MSSWWWCPTSSAASYTLEVTGEESKISAILELLRPFGVQEVVRTGKVAMHRGMRQLDVRNEKEKAA